MTKFYSLIVLCLFVVSAHAQTVYPDYVDGQIYFKIKKETRIFRSLDGDFSNLPVSTIPFLDKVQKSAGITHLEQPFVHAKKSAELHRIFRLTFTNVAAIDAIIQQLVATGEIEYAEKVPLTKTTLTVNDPSYPSQWGLATINAPLAWNYFSTGSTIVIAIVDDAVERTHPDLSANLWVNPGDPTVNGVDDDGNGYTDDVNGWDVADNDNNPNPPTTAFDHGTHVAGIAGARSNNSTGVASIGFSTKLMCVKSTNSATSVTNGYDGVLYAADNGADVINMSWGGSGSSVSTQAIIDYAFAQGCVLIAAAGNDDVSTIFYPAGYTNVIAVAATSSSDAKASFSNYGTWVDISAPGNNIYSTTVGASYGNKSGTSMASPMVAGLAGLMLSLNPALTNVDIRNCLTSSADLIDAVNPSYIGQLGAGRIDAEAAMNCVSTTLSWAPVADFVANVTTVTAGGYVDFTDLSVYTPTSWTWSFPGGTPASYSGVNPPNIVYNTPGTYNVQLTVSNVNGTDVELKTGYITVIADGGCGKLNFPVPAGWNLVNYYTGATFAADGWINGVNTYADREKAAYFDASATPYTTLNNVWIAFGLAWCNNTADIVPVKIYDGTSGSPTTLLGTTNLTMGQIMSDVAGNYYTEANFIVNPVTLPASKRFFVSVDLTNLSWTGIKDTLSIVSNSNGETVPSAIWERQSDLLWYQYNTAGSWGLNASLVVHPWLTSTPTNATFTNSSLTICEDNSVSFNGTGSTYEDTLLWYFPGGTPTLSNSLTESVMYNTPGSYLATLYVVGGGCDLLDSMFVTVNVNAKPTISATCPTPEICSGGSATITATGGSTYSWSHGATTSVTTVFPTGTTTYTVTGYNAFGCENSATIEIEVLTPPTADATVGATLCSGSPISFDGSLSDDATSFLWSLTGGSPATSTATGGTVTFTTGGTYNIQLDVTNICGTDTDIIPITVNTSPTASFSFSTDTVCTTNGLVALSATPSGGAFTGTAITGTNFDPATAGAGNYTITYTFTDANSCVGTASDNIVVEICSGIEEMLNAGGIVVFPNPASTVLNIIGQTNFDRIQMSDATGRIVARTQFTPTTTQTIDLNNLPNGVYNIQLISSTNVIYSNRIVVSK
ncbi:MAG TPA: S8 family serine peptidase [Flavobacteriales bacterium]|nr:S8 family serine peptidase [Flavobacteriales bacterium]